jgi:hypothetical protein
MLSLPPEQILALIKHEHAELRRLAAQDALVDAADGNRAWTARWPEGLVRLWSAIRLRPEVHASDVIWPTLQDYPYPHPRPH